MEGIKNNFESCVNVVTTSRLKTVVQLTAEASGNIVQYNRLAGRRIDILMASFGLNVSFLFFQCLNSALGGQSTVTPVGTHVYCNPIRIPPATCFCIKELICSRTEIDGKFESFHFKNCLN